jgi:hypothetical protein
MHGDLIGSMPAILPTLFWTKRGICVPVQTSALSSSMRTMALIGSSGAWAR